MSRAHADDPFAAVHRAARRRTVALSATLALAAGALVAVMWAAPASVAAPVLATAAPVAAAVDQTASGALPAGPAPAADPEAPVAEPAPAGGAAPAAAPDSPPEAGAPASTDVVTSDPVTAPVDQSHAPAPSEAAGPTAGSGPASYDITVDASGYQAELDRCLWVRMDIGAAAPIVGAHNTCGGEVVLDLRIGDLVTLRGQDLDGVYVVAESRDAHAGDDAATATSGMIATVIVQTCYLEGDGVRLVGLVPA